MPAPQAASAVILFAAVLGQGATGGLGFTPGLLIPKAERLNPLAGLTLT